MLTQGLRPAIFRVEGADFFHQRQGRLHPGFDDFLREVKGIKDVLMNGDEAMAAGRMAHYRELPIPWQAGIQRRNSHTSKEMRAESSRQLPRGK